MQSPGWQKARAVPFREADPVLSEGIDCKEDTELNGEDLIPAGECCFVESAGTLSVCWKFHMFPRFSDQGQAQLIAVLLTQLAVGLHAYRSLDGDRAVRYRPFTLASCLCSCSEWQLPPDLKTMGYTCRQRVSSFDISSQIGHRVSAEHPLRPAPTTYEGIIGATWF